MKLLKLILFLLVTNTALGQSYWSFKERPIVPIYNTAAELNDSTTTTDFSSNSNSFSQKAKASTNANGCIDNIDFENGDFTNWKCYKGTAKSNSTGNYVVWSPNTPVSPIANRHQIISATSLPINDPYGGFPRLCPQGGKYSIQLGNNSISSQAEKVTCSFQIPADQNNFQIEYFYAVVFQDPNHPFTEQPRFQAKVYDANNSSNVIDCASYDFTAGSGLPGFQVSPVDNSVLYKPWSAVTINLSGYAGHTVILEFTTEDCTLGAHFGYAYIDVNSSCVSLISNSTYCNNTPSITLNAPSGYEKYNWYNSTYTKLLGTSQTITLSPPPPSNEIINVDLVPYAGFGCRDTAYTILKVNPQPITSFNSDTTVCVGKPISFINKSTISDNTTLTYFWDFGDNTTSTSLDYTKTYNIAGSYKVKLITTSINGCTDSVVKNISVGDLAPINPINGNQNLCIGQNEVLQNTTTGGIWKSLNPSVATISNTGLVTALAAGNDIIHYVVTNKYGCSDSVTFTLNVIPTSYSTINAVICSGNIFTINGISYDVAGSYITHLMNIAGCDSVVTLNLTVKQPTNSTTNISICTGDSYTFNGIVYKTAGIYDTLLVNKAGCDSTATLKLTVNSPTYSTTDVSICNGDSYTFNGTNYNTPGTFVMHLINKAGCDSIATLNLTVKQPSSSTTDISICNGTLYSFNGISYNSAGTYVAHLTNKAGCDSIATLNLTVKLPTVSTTNAAICQGDSYTFNGTTYTNAGAYSTHLINKAGCDSTATLNLTIKLPTISTTNVAICQGDSYTFNGTAYNLTGIYTVHFINSVGCDSTATLNLTVKLPTVSTTDAAICQGDSYTFNGTTYTNTGTYSTHLLNKAGCDSTATLNLTIKLPTVSTTNAAICQGDSYTFNGTIYNLAGTYSAHLLNKGGCDSTATLNLAVKLPTVSSTNATICLGDSYTFNGTIYNLAGTYSAHLINKADCDSTATLMLIVNTPTSSIITVPINNGDSYVFNGTSYNIAGTYVKHLINKVGCDSSAILNLFIKLPTFSTTKAAICQGDSYTYNGTTYTTAGTYSTHLLNKAGCDSTATLNLTVKLSTVSTTNAAICQGENYIFNGTTFTTAGTFIAHLINKDGCDSTATLNLTIKLPTVSTTNAAICQGENYIFNGTTYTTAGTYSTHLLNKEGCDSTATLNLTVKLPTVSTTNAAICQGDSYTFNGTTYTNVGTFIAHLINKAGCDSTATLNLTIKLPTVSTTNATICQGENYIFNGTTFTTAGTFIAHLINKAGCDSTATLNLTIKLPTFSTTNAAICQGDSYTFNGTTYTTTGNYTTHLISKTGCDSTATLNLTVNKPTSSITNASICRPESYTFNGKVYNTTGTFVANLTNNQGCDSIATLNLTLKTPNISISNAFICLGESYTFNGYTYTKKGSYLAHLINVAGCDSIALLVLRVGKPTSSTTRLIVSSTKLPFVWNKMVYTDPGIHTSPTHFLNSVGCDSTAILELTVKAPSTSIVTATICDGDSYLFNGLNYDKTGIYTLHLTNPMGVDSIATLNLIVNSKYSSYNNILLISGETYFINGHTYSESGTYSDVFKTSFGCDSTVVTDVTTIKVPNTITPNGDGYNDKFMTDWHVQIFNRNGIMLYDGVDGWDGKYNNKPVSKDTYFYVLFYTSESHIKTKEGYLMVIR